MIASGADRRKIRDSILEAANKHPNSRVAKLIHGVEEERSQKSIVLLLMELAEHPEYSTDFGISLHYYLDLFEHLGINRDIVLNEAGLLLLSSSKVYSRRVDFVQELVERQILTLSNTEKEIVDNSSNNAAKTSIEKPKRTRKRLVEAVTDPYEVELVPRKYRKLTEDKRFGGTTNASEKAKATASKYYKIDSEQYLHPAAWMHASIVDLENEEDIDSKRNYKLFTYHVEHRYNTLVPDINFRLHFKVKDYIDEEEERLADELEQNSDLRSNDLTDWPPLSEAYIEKYLDLEDKVLAIGGISNHRKKRKLDNTLSSQSKKEDSLEIVQNSNIANNESNIDCHPDLTGSSALESTASQTVLNESVVDSGISSQNISTDDISTKCNESTQLNDSSSLNVSAADTSVSTTNLTSPDLSLDLTQNLNSTEKSLLESTDQQQSETTIDASNTSTQNDMSTSSVTNLSQNTSAINENDGSQVTTEKLNEQQTQNDTGLGESISEQNQSKEASTLAIATETETDKDNNNALEAANEAQTAATNAVADSGEKTEDDDKSELDKIRVYLPNMDDEGVFFSDLEDHVQRMLSPKVLTTDVFPCIENKDKITVHVDDEIKTLLNIVEDDEAPPMTTYTMPVQVRPPTPPLVLNIFKIHEKMLRRRILFKLGAEMDQFLQSRSMKRTHNVDTSEPRHYRPMKLFSESPDVTPDVSQSPKRTKKCVNTATDLTDCNVLSDDDDASEFLGFTEEEQANKMLLHRLSRDSGVCSDVPTTPNAGSTRVSINEDFHKALQATKEPLDAADVRGSCETTVELENVADGSANCLETLQSSENNNEKGAEEQASHAANSNEGCLAAAVSDQQLVDQGTNEAAKAAVAVEVSEVATEENCADKDKDSTEAAATDKEASDLTTTTNKEASDLTTTKNKEASDLTTTTNKEASDLTTTKNKEASDLTTTTNNEASDLTTTTEAVAVALEGAAAENCTNKANEQTAANDCVEDNDDDNTCTRSTLFNADDWLSADNEQDVEQSKTKIQKWHEYLQPILAKARDRHHFDIFHLGTEIMNELQKPVAAMEQHQHSTASAAITFQDVMNEKDESYVSRYFLSTLLLANQNNVKINVNNKCSERPSSWHDIKLELLDTKRHTVAIEDNIGIIQTKAPAVGTTTARKVKKSSGREAYENVSVCQEMLQVNLNVVRPLKQIEKVPNTNDDYDSGIYSNEDCVT